MALVLSWLFLTFINVIWRHLAWHLSCITENNYQTNKRHDQPKPGLYRTLWRHSGTQNKSCPVTSSEIPHFLLDSFTSRETPSRLATHPVTWVDVTPFSLIKVSFSRWRNFRFQCIPACTGTVSVAILERRRQGDDVDYFKWIGCDFVSQRLGCLLVRPVPGLSG